MKPRQLSYIICIFLSGAFSARAQSVADGSPSQAMRAVEYERILWEGASPADANAALLARAECLIGLERWADALNSLERLRMFALSSQEREKAAYLKALTNYRMGNNYAAAAILQELQASDKEIPGLKSPTTAAFLGIIPTAGHLYVQRPDLWWTTAGTVATGAFIVFEAVSGCWLTAALGGALLVNAFYIDANLRRVPAMAEEYNAAAVEKFVKEQLDALL